VGVAGAPTIAAGPPQERRAPFGWIRRGRAADPVAFPELVWAHHLRQQELHDGGEPYAGPAQERYRRMQSEFEARHGDIVAAYWSTAEASGVALTLRTRPGLLADIVRLHWATDWTTRELPQLTSLLFRCESLAVQVGEVLRDTSKRVAMHRLFNVVSFVLAFAESPSVKDGAAVKEMIELQSRQLDDLEKYYRNAAGRSGQVVYLSGALLGVLPFLLLGLVAGLFGAFDAGKEAVRTGALCFAAGGVGALVSVMSRMNTGRTGVDWEFGKDTLRTLGSLRPFVGGVFGLATYFGLRSGLVSLDLGNGSQNFYFYVLFSFVAGFSERFAKDMLLGSTLGRAGGGKDELPPSPPLTVPPAALTPGAEADASS
jgi:hypothetical protein